MSALRIADDFTLDTERFDDEGLRIGIFASPGAGKGYLLGVLLEELIDAGYPCVLVDPESELWTFREVGALVIGGEHGHVPFPVEQPAVIEEALRFTLETATPVVFDLGASETDTDIRDAFEQVARPFWRLVSAARQPSVFAVTEAHVVAPQQIPPKEKASPTLPAILTRGRKRGVTIALETQRISDIAKSVISHCNVRFIGRTDFEDDVKRAASGIRGVTVADVQSLERGTFYVPRLHDGPIHVRERRVTHGAITPGQGEVTLRREESPERVAELAARLAALIETPADADEPSAPDGTNGADAKRIAELERSLARAHKDAAGHEERIADLVDQLEQQDRDLREADSLVASAERLREALAGLLGDGVAVFSAGGGYPGDDHVVQLIRENAPASGGVTLLPVAKLRADYLERSALRLAEIVRGLEDDERDALLFLIGQDRFMSINAVALGLSGSDSGGTRSRWQKALASLVSKKLVTVGGSGRTQRRADVEGFVRSGLASHNPSDDEITQVRDRALSLLDTTDRARP